MNTTRALLASTMCRLWVRGYTRNLPHDEAQRRREEIESDLFEHAVEAELAGVGNQRFNAEVLARVLVGVPADLSWRRATRQPHTRLALGATSMSLSKSTSTRLLYGLGALVIVYAWSAPIAMTAFWLFDDVPETDISWQMRTFWVAIPAIASVALAIGLKIRRHAPRRGLKLIVGGALGPAVWFWFLPVYLPVMIALIALAVSVTPRKSTQIAAA